MDKKILMIAMVVIAAVAVVCGGLIVMNSTTEYKNVTVASATFEIPKDINGTVNNGEYRFGMGTSNFTSDELFVFIVETGLLTNVVTEDYVASYTHGKSDVKELEEKNGVKYYELEDGAFKYLAITKIGSVLLMVAADDLDIINHILETITFSNDDGSSNTTEITNNNENTNSSSAGGDDPKKYLPKTAKEAGTYIGDGYGGASSPSYDYDDEDYDVYIAGYDYDSDVVTEEVWE